MLKLVLEEGLWKIERLDGSRIEAICVESHPRGIRKYRELTFTELDDAKEYVTIAAMYPESLNQYQW